MIVNLIGAVLSEAESDAESNCLEPMAIDSRNGVDLPSWISVLYVQGEVVCPWLSCLSTSTFATENTCSSSSSIFPSNRNQYQHLQRYSLGDPRCCCSMLWMAASPPFIRNTASFPVFRDLLQWHCQ